ncbi:efflux RND transporter periplasmic adaptor subunit [Desulforegula conservatrix]|uniref:efflux RND transporter periplasmic adaptor subunit n=1 Tax=Desulforegula conservatrix TaxID=153026 RepID=UPI0003FEDBB1|nr:efflux RND transporter periplasmic adaptor subunit [Desulforegula conservatrix]
MNLSGKKAVLLISAVIIVIALTGWALFGKNGDSVKYRTAIAKKGDLDATISATGTIEPEELVDVGAQVAGKILSFGKDGSGKLIDYGSVVEEGMRLALIDDSLYRYDRDQAHAAFEQAKADILIAEAELGQADTKLTQTEREWTRTKKAGGKDVISETDLDAALSAYESAKDGLSLSKARLIQTKKAAVKAESLLKKAQQNLDYCTIISPVNGVIIDRRVNIGQTVVSSMSAPSLFLIAKDLKKLQIWVAVNEADIGRIKPKQSVSFTVDAWPGEVFKGETGKIRLNATMTQNVVTYTVEVNIDNSDGKLLPYLSANVKFLIDSRKDILLVPNASIRWSPNEDNIDPDLKKKKRGDNAATGSEPKKSADGNSVGNASVWVKDGRYVKSIAVTTGLTDGSNTEISGGDLKEGTEVIIGEEVAEDKNSKSQGGSPFTPKFGRKPR